MGNPQELWGSLSSFTFVNLHRRESRQLKLKSGIESTDQPQDQIYPIYTHSQEAVMCEHTLSILMRSNTKAPSAIQIKNTLGMSQRLPSHTAKDYQKKKKY